MDPINYTADLINSRDVVARIDELDTQEGVRNGDDMRELRSLLALADQGEEHRDWLHGATLIRETYFTEYVRQYVSDLNGDLLSRLPHSIVVDWEATARDAMTEYSEIEYNGVTYYVR